MPPPQLYRFGPFTLDTASFRLSRGHADVPLTPKAFELLALLVRERHRVLTKQELLDAVWRDTAVTENTLTQRIKEIREALGDSAHESAYVRTVPRIGFQFIGEVAAAETAVGAAERVVGDPLTGRPATPAASSVVPDDGPALSGGARATRAPRWAAYGVILLGALAVAGAFVYGKRTGTATPAASPSGRVMLAVLPFDDLSGDIEQRYLSDGLTEELIAEFGRLDPTRLGVIARTSAMTYRNTTKSVAQIARELGVDFVFEGSVRREGDRVRIVAQLVRASDQTHVWAERYDGDVRSVLALQSEVARAIAAQTRIRLSAAASERLGRAVIVNPEAYQAYLKGRFFLNQRTGDAIQKALEHFERAIAIDSTYAQAYAGAADAHELLASYGHIGPRESMQRSLDAARRALELDPELAEPYTSLGTIHASYTWEWARAEQAYLRALQLNASSAAAHKGYGELLSFLGRHPDAIAELQRAVELDPVSLVMHANLGIVYYRARRYDEALAQMRQAASLDANHLLVHLNVGLIHAAAGSNDDAIEAFQRAAALAPRFGDALGLLGYAYARAGRHDEARAVGLQLERLSSDGYVSPYIRALYHLGPGDRDRALAELERAYEERSWLVALLKVDPLLDELRTDPRFQALVSRLEFPG